ncbi:MAG: FAD binding domain-containing protein, partial [Bryobacterales bacterium]|nr:FAD binding domain-containing protein [Bryobacterales bacterium]
MQSFEYANPATLKEALALLGTREGESDVLAGGTDQISLMKDMVHTPKRVVNIKGIATLHGIQVSSAGLHIGATTTFAELLGSAAIRTRYPSLHTAVKGVSSPQIRNMGTAGGDLCQRPRCWYFRQGYGLLARDSNGRSLPVEGRNEFHAILGGGPAYFVSASSLGPPLIALGAKVKLASAAGERELPVEQFFVVPASDGSREIALRPDEILTSILVPAPRQRNATYEVRQKEALDWPLATASVALSMRGATVAKASIVLGHVAPTPWRAVEAEKAITGASITEAAAEQAGKAAVAGARPLSENAYKV